MPTSIAASRAPLLCLFAGLFVGCGAARPADGHAALPAAARYETEARRGAVLSPGQPGARREALAHAVASGGRDAGVALRGDRRLAWLARHFASECGAAPAPDALARAARHVGLVDTELALLCVAAVTRAQLPAAAGAATAERAGALQSTHFGAFVPEGTARAVVVLSRRALSLAPVPRNVTPGSVLRVRGRLAAVYSDPKLIVRGPDGARAIPAGGGPEFDLQLPLARAGCYTLQLEARAGARRHTLAELELSAQSDDASPHACASAAAYFSAASQQRISALQRALALRIGELRAAHGLPALTHDDALVQHAAQTRGGELPAHTLGSGLALLAVAHGRDEAALWAALARDGVARATLINPDVTHLGIAASADGGELRARVLVARLAPAADVELAPARVLEALNHNRAARSVTALRPDAALTRIARSAANAFFERPERGEQEIVAAANAELERFALSYHRVAALAVLVLDPLEAAALEPALDAGARAAGIAVASGVRASTGARTVAVVIALGWER